MIETRQARGCGRWGSPVVLRGCATSSASPGDEGMADGITAHVLSVFPSGEAVLEPRDPRELCSIGYIVYTSGSTGSLRPARALTDA